MKIFYFSTLTFILFIFSTNSKAQYSTSPSSSSPQQAPVSPSTTIGKSKNKLNTNVFEKENEDYSFSAKVRTIRETRDDVEVFFDIENPKGAFVLPKTDKQPTFMKLLEKSRKPTGKSVSVQADKNKIITSVEYSESP